VLYRVLPAQVDYDEELHKRSADSFDYLKGLHLGTVATNVSEADRRPDAKHPFIPPGPGGGCYVPCLTGHEAELL
jgi:hypothetical protein